MTGREVEHGLPEWRTSPYPLCYTLWATLCGQHARVSQGGRWREEPMEKEEGMKIEWIFTQ